jgi:hypothetical protein
MNGFSISDISVDDIERLLHGYDAESTFISSNGKWVSPHKNDKIGVFFIIDSADSTSILISEKPYFS